MHFRKVILKLIQVKLNGPPSTGLDFCECKIQIKISDPVYLYHQQTNDSVSRILDTYFKGDNKIQKRTLSNDKNAIGA